MDAYSVEVMKMTKAFTGTLQITQEDRLHPVEYRQVTMMMMMMMMMMVVEVVVVMLFVVVTKNGCIFTGTLDIRQDVGDEGDGVVDYQDHNDDYGGDAGGGGSGGGRSGGGGENG